MKLLLDKELNDMCILSQNLQKATESFFNTF